MVYSHEGPWWTLYLAVRGVATSKEPLRDRVAEVQEICSHIQIPAFFPSAAAERITKLQSRVARPPENEDEACEIIWDLVDALCMAVRADLGRAG